VGAGGTAANALPPFLWLPAGSAGGTQLELVLPVLAGIAALTDDSGGQLHPVCSVVTNVACVAWRFDAHRNDASWLTHAASLLLINATDGGRSAVTLAWVTSASAATAAPAGGAPLLPAPVALPPGAVSWVNMPLHAAAGIPAPTLGTALVSVVWGAPTALYGGAGYDDSANVVVAPLGAPWSQSPAPSTLCVAVLEVPSAGGLLAAPPAAGNVTAGAITVHGPWCATTTRDALPPPTVPLRAAACDEARCSADGAWLLPPGAATTDAADGDGNWLNGAPANITIPMAVLSGTTVVGDGTLTAAPLRGRVWTAQPWPLPARLTAFLPLSELCGPDAPIEVDVLVAPPAAASSSPVMGADGNNASVAATIVCTIEDGDAVIAVSSPTVTVTVPAPGGTGFLQLAVDTTTTGGAVQVSTTAGAASVPITLPAGIGSAWLGLHVRLAGVVWLQSAALTAHISGLTVRAGDAPADAQTAVARSWERTPRGLALVAPTGVAVDAAAVRDVTAMLALRRAVQSPESCIPAVGTLRLAGAPSACIGCEVEVVYTPDPAFADGTAGDDVPRWCWWLSLCSGSSSGSGSGTGSDGAACSTTVGVNASAVGFASAVTRHRAVRLTVPVPRSGVSTLCAAPVYDAAACVEVVGLAGVADAASSYLHRVNNTASDLPAPVVGAAPLWTAATWGVLCRDAALNVRACEPAVSAYGDNGTVIATVVVPTPTGANVTLPRRPTCGNVVLHVAVDGTAVGGSPLLLTGRPVGLPMALGTALLATTPTVSVGDAATFIWSLADVSGCGLPATAAAAAGVDLNVSAVRIPDGGVCMAKPTVAVNLDTSTVLVTTGCPGIYNITARVGGAPVTVTPPPWQPAATSYQYMLAVTPRAMAPVATLRMLAPSVTTCADCWTPLAAADFDGAGGWDTTYAVVVTWGATGEALPPCTDADASSPPDTVTTTPVCGMPAWPPANNATGSAAAACAGVQRNGTTRAVVGVRLRVASTAPVSLAVAVVGLRTAAARDVANGSVVISRVTSGAVAVGADGVSPDPAAVSPALEVAYAAIDGAPYLRARVALVDSHGNSATPDSQCDDGSTWHLTVQPRSGGGIISATLSWNASSAVWDAVAAPLPCDCCSVNATIYGGRASASVATVLLPVRSLACDDATTGSDDATTTSTPLLVPYVDALYLAPAPAVANNNSTGWLGAGVWGALSPGRWNPVPWPSAASASVWTGNASDSGSTAALAAWLGPWVQRVVSANAGSVDANATLAAFSGNVTYVVRSNSSGTLVCAVHSSPPSALLRVPPRSDVATLLASWAPLPDAQRPSIEYAAAGISPASCGTNTSIGWGAVPFALGTPSSSCAGAACNLSLPVQWLLPRGGWDIEVALNYSVVGGGLRDGTVAAGGSVLASGGFVVRHDTLSVAFSVSLPGAPDATAGGEAVTVWVTAVGGLTTASTVRLLPNGAANASSAAAVAAAIIAAVNNSALPSNADAAAAVMATVPAVSDDDCAYLWRWRSSTPGGDGSVAACHWVGVVPSTAAWMATQTCVPSLMCSTTAATLAPATVASFGGGQSASVTVTPPVQAPSLHGALLVQPAAGGAITLGVPTALQVVLGAESAADGCVTALCAAAGAWPLNVTLLACATGAVANTTTVNVSLPAIPVAAASLAVASVLFLASLYCDLAATGAVAANQTRWAPWTPLVAASTGLTATAAVQAPPLTPAPWWRNASAVAASAAIVTASDAVSVFVDSAAAGNWSVVWQRAGDALDAATWLSLPAGGVDGTEQAAAPVVLAPPLPANTLVLSPGDADGTSLGSLALARLPLQLTDAPPGALPPSVPLTTRRDLASELWHAAAEPLPTMPPVLSTAFAGSAEALTASWMTTTASYPDGDAVLAAWAAGVVNSSMDQGAGLADGEKLGSSAALTTCSHARGSLPSPDTCNTNSTGQSLVDIVPAPYAMTFSYQYSYKPQICTQTSLFVKVANAFERISTPGESGAYAAAVGSANYLPITFTAISPSGRRTVATGLADTLNDDAVWRTNLLLSELSVAAYYNIYAVHKTAGLLLPRVAGTTNAETLMTDNPPEAAMTPWLMGPMVSGWIEGSATAVRGVAWNIDCAGNNPTDGAYRANNQLGSAFCAAIDGNSSLVTRFAVPNPDGASMDNSSLPRRSLLGITPSLLPPLPPGAPLQRTLSLYFTPYSQMNDATCPPPAAGVTVVNFTIAVTNTAPPPLVNAIVASTRAQACGSTAGWKVGSPTSLLLTFRWGNGTLAPAPALILINVALGTGGRLYGGGGLGLTANHHCGRVLQRHHSKRDRRAAPKRPEQLV